MHYSALAVQRRVQTQPNMPVWEDAAPCIRFPCVVGVTTAQEDPAGYTEASFTIPAVLARIDPEDLQPRTTVWLFDGSEPCFYGYVVKSLPNRDGSITVTLDGMYRAAAKTGMRIVWSDGGIGPNTAPSPGNSSAANVNVNSFGELVIAFPVGAKVSGGDYAAVDYFLFNEPAGLRDKKLMDGWSLSLSGKSTYDSGTIFEARIYGMSDPTDPSPDLLQRFPVAPADRQETADASSGDNTAQWPAGNGYRLFRVGLYALSGDASLDHDRRLVLDEFRVTTEAAQVGLVENRDTGFLIQELFEQAGNGRDTHYLLQEEHPSTVGGMVTGNIELRHHYVAGVNYPDWTAPQAIIEFLASVDGSRVAMWEPTLAPPRNALVTTDTTRQYWYRQPAELVFADWSDLDDPDYTIRLQRGAVWEPDGQPDEIITGVYVDYGTQRGRTLTLFAQDESDENYLYQQGWHEADFWQIAPAVKTVTASTLSEQYVASRGQPAFSGTLTVSADATGAIEGRGGERILKLSQVKCGSVVRVVDAKGPNAGRVSRVEFTARSATSPEQIVLSINSPASVRLDRRLARIALKADQSRTQ